MDITNDFVYVCIEIYPQGIWIDGSITEHPSYAHIAVITYQHSFMFEEGRCVAVRIKVPRRQTNELCRIVCSEGT